MGAFDNFRSVCRYCLSSRKGLTHAERMERLYGPRSAEFDACHVRSLRGGRELFERLPAPEGGVWIDMGAGTGANLECLGDRLAKLSRVYLVEASPSMRAVAQRRVERHGWRNVEVVDADALTFAPATGPADVVTFCYSLAVIRPWLAALERARELLRPGGLVGVAEFHVSPDVAPHGRVQHNWLTRRLSVALHHLWEVFPDPDHIPYLHSRFAVPHFAEYSLGTLVPGLRFPYFVFIGRNEPPPENVPAPAAAS